MWFRNLQIYKVAGNAAETQFDAVSMIEKMTPRAFTPCGNLDAQSIGWVPPRDAGDLVHKVGRHLLFAMRTETRKVPRNVVDQVAKARAAELEEQQGFKPGRKQMKELREQVLDELLPRAFSQIRDTRVWLDPAGGWLVVDSARGAVADDVFKLLLKTFESLPFASLRTERSPLACMTDWLASDEAPTGFTVDADTELRAAGEGKATVRYIRHTLEADDVRRHIATGKQCTRLALTWSDRISFVLTESLTLRRLAPLDVLKENGNAETVENADERFDSDMLLMCGELDQMLRDLVDALGGFELPKSPVTTVVPVRVDATGKTMTDKAEGKPYGAFVAAGWTDAQLVDHGYMAA